MLNAALIAVLGAIWFGVMYKWYGDLIDRKLISPNDDNVTPANSLRDNIDYFPSRSGILFGHHFSSIAGAGPIVGPIFAYYLFGWLPAMLWILLGSVFIGAVHDYTALMTSVRSRGVSISELAQRHVSNTARWIFSIFLWVALVLVIAVFGVLTAQTFAEKPEIVIPSLGLILIAILFGMLVYQRNLNLVFGTIVALVLMFVLIVLGERFPIQASADLWLVVALLYSFVAATIPVWVLLQPRDYLSMYVLIIGIGLAFVSLLVMQPEITGPAFVGLTSKSGPLWPILFITVACGAVSGFHSAVSSGTSSKQLTRETHGKRIAFGGMLTEGLLALIVVLLISSVLYWDKAPAKELSGYVFQTLLSESPNITFGTAMGRAMESIGIPLQYGIAFGVLMLNAFIFTTLDTCARLSRYIMSETVGRKIPLLGNIHVATGIGLLFAYILTTGNNWKILWPAFGAANQLIGGLTLLVVTAYMFGFKKATVYTLIPGGLMLVTTEGALIYQLIWQYLPAGNYVLSALAGVLMILGVVIAVEVYRRLQRKDQLVFVEGEVAVGKL